MSDQRRNKPRVESLPLRWIPQPAITRSEATYLSINSVRAYIRSASRTIEVSRRAQAVVWGMTHGFVEQGGHDEDRARIGNDA